MAKRENCDNVVQVTNKQLKGLYDEMYRIWHLLAGAEELVETNSACVEVIISCAKCKLHKAGCSIQPLIDFNEPAERHALDPELIADFI